MNFSHADWHETCIIHSALCKHLHQKGELLTGLQQYTGFTVYHMKIDNFHTG